MARDDARPAHKLKHLILTADDFGRSPAVNDAILRHHAAGFLTQASLMVNEPHAADAVRLAPPGLCIGLHLTLCAGLASAPSAITDADGAFTSSPALAGVRYFFGRKCEPALRAEIRAQFERFRAFGLTPTYWDGHAHLHLHPTVLRLTLPIAHEFGFRFIRLVREPGLLLPWIFRRLSERARPPLFARCIDYADRVFGLRDTGHMDTAAFTRLLDRLPRGTSEIYFHPGAEPAELDLPRLRHILKRRKIQLTSCSRHLL